MKSIDEADAQARFDEILDEAQQQPIVIRRQGRDVAVIVRAADYERLRALNVQSFLGLREEVARDQGGPPPTHTLLKEIGYAGWSEVLSARA